MPSRRPPGRSTSWIDGVPLALGTIRTVGLAALALVIGLSIVACESDPKPAPQPGFDEVVRKKSVTVYPALVWSSQASYDRASARSLGAFAGDRASEVRISDEEIVPDSTTPTRMRGWARVTEESAAKHVRNHPLQTDLGLWAVYLFAPGTEQIVEIHAVLFDGSGAVIRRFTIERFDKPPRTAAECTELVKRVVLTRERIYAPPPVKRRE